MSARNLTALGFSVGMGVITGRCNRQDRQKGRTSAEEPRRSLHIQANASGTAEGG